ncbi:glycogen-debranching protein [Thiohalocapsa marina]|uniref:Glycogen-debranching protein n=1 Tax=Thiohalocapsa marina TaxID=424902 RepID=A0A5M8FQ44_9GAMM|nr:isoamylase [Thiohalocapsa marina]KAA6182982.1 glycogen-debranching protein [Thiohalocapsa marina]
MYPVRPGRRYPPGASVVDHGINFSIYSRHATGATLLLYADAAAKTPFQVIALDPEVNHTFFSWHVQVVGLPPGTRYTWRMQGPHDPVGHGWLFDGDVELVDPWARAVDTRRWDRARRCREGAQAHDSIRGIVLADDYDWEGDQLLRMPSQEMIIYELHVGGFTRHPSAGVAHPGSFLGLVEKIPYLRSLGVTHVELLPVMAFDEQDVPEPVGAAGLSNFWGYSTHSFFAPHPGYCVDPERQRDEFRDLVKALHRAGIGVLLDVVFNHTAEGGQGGPLINFKGIGNETFYMLDAADRSRYLDFTGCGNTVNANHPFMARFIIDCLEYWVREMHVDGFRFDLASAMARDENGVPMHHPPVLWGIELSDVLAGSKIIAEAWDAAGLYHVGSFPGYRWMEWNGRYRDDLRRAVRGDGGLIDQVATRIAGSSDLYQGNLRHPINSINFITCHDGFTLLDLVSCDKKANAPNHEGNRDGCAHNLSWNCGAEGPCNSPAILALRRRQAKNFMAVLFLSQGIPMLNAGDELLRSAACNNNTWCQDNALGWIDWSLAERNADMLRFVRGMIALRKRHPSLRRRQFLSHREIEWFGPEGEAPDWNAEDARELAFTLHGRGGEEPPLHAVFNFGAGACTFVLPTLPGWSWAVAARTWARSPQDLVERSDQRPLSRSRVGVPAHGVLVLEGIRTDGG